MITFREYNQHLCFTEVELDDFNVRGILVIGTERAVVWDTLSHPKDMKFFLPLIQNKELSIVYSHADWDHIWGTAGLPYQGKMIIGHSNCLTRFATDVPETLYKKQMSESHTWDEVKLVKPNLTFQREVSFDLGGLMLNLHFLPGHSADSVVAFMPEQGVLLAGDTIETPFPVIDENSPLDLWIAELQRWANNSRVQTVIPAHGTIGGPEIIRANIDYLQRIKDGVEIEVPESLNNFYRKTHQRNLRYKMDKP